MSRKDAKARGCFKCRLCDRFFTRSEHRTRHERIHSSERPYGCNRCSSTFFRRDLLIRHLRMVHRLQLAKNDPLPPPLTEEELMERTASQPSDDRAMLAATRRLSGQAKSQLASQLSQSPATSRSQSARAMSASHQTSGATSRSESRSQSPDSTPRSQPVSPGHGELTPKPEEAAVIAPQYSAHATSNPLMAPPTVAAPTSQLGAQLAAQQLTGVSAAAVAAAAAAASVVPGQLPADLATEQLNARLGGPPQTITPLGLSRHYMSPSPDPLRVNDIDLDISDIRSEFSELSDIRSELSEPFGAFAGPFVGSFSNLGDATAAPPLITRAGSHSSSSYSPQSPHWLPGELASHISLDSPGNREPFDVNDLTADYAPPDAFINSVLHDDLPYNQVYLEPPSLSAMYDKHYPVSTTIIDPTADLAAPPHCFAMPSATAPLDTASTEVSDASIEAFVQRDL